MQHIPLKSRKSFLFFYLLILIIPALFINLGFMPLILDEATRANVALEMMYSGNYMVPTINGEFYYNKPPLFNWIQIIFMKLTGSTSELSLRLPVVLSLIFFSLTIYQTQKREGGRVVALFSALAFLTCGRILIYDSLRGLIDITFSWVIYLMFWTIYTYGKRKKFLALFIITYVLAALAFLMKGLPALVFLGITLLAYFTYTRQFIKLFSLAHLAGFGFLVLIIGSYFLAYSQHNSLIVYFETLWSESSKRTFLDNSLWQSIKHLFLFPVDFVYHFLPWTALIFVFFLRDARRLIRKNEFSTFSLLIFVFNILVYWVSPAIFPRYLFMFLPLLFFVLFHIYIYSVESFFIKRIFHPLVIFMASLISLLIVLAPIIANRELYSQFYLKYFLILVLTSPLVFLLIKPKQKILLLVGFLLIARIAFNFFVLPDRLASGTALYQKNGAIVAGELTRSEPLYVYEDTKIHHASTYYITRTRGEILERWRGEVLPGYFYIVEKEDLEYLPPYKLIHSFETRIEALRLYLIRIEDNFKPGNKNNT